MRYFFALLIWVGALDALAATQVPAASPRPFLGAKDWYAMVTREPATVVLDARGETGTFDKRRIRNARKLPIEAWFTALHEDGVVDEAAWSRRIADLGLHRDDRVAIYDMGGLSFASVVRSVLIGFGIREVIIAEGGFAALEKQLPAGAFEQGEHARWAIEPWSASWDGTAPVPKLIDGNSMLAAIGNRDAFVFDVRSADEFRGNDNQSDDPRHGHLPSALSLPKQLFTDSKGSVISRDEVRNLMRGFGVALEHPIFVYCHGGGRSSFVSNVLIDAGFANVHNYLGSWGEWSRDASLPIVPPIAADHSH